MKTVQHSIRLPATLDKTLRALAEQRGETVYATLQRSVKVGIEGQAHPSVGDPDDREMIAEVAAIGVRLVDVERLVDRTLFTACAAYCYARSAAMGGGKTDDVIGAETNRAYDRQLAAIGERP